MSSMFSIHPKVGVARIGNSKSAFYLGPESTGGLPLECDAGGNPTVPDGKPIEVSRFKDAVGGIKRQAARFKIFEHLSDGSHAEVTLADPRVARIEWTAHIANKKPIWYTFSELQGDLEFGDWNSYEKQHVPLNNADETDHEKRKKLMIDPGPRTVTAPGDRQAFSRYTPPANYAHFSFPPTTLHPSIDTLGEIMMDDDGRLVLLGGFGNSAGMSPLSNFRGAQEWWDDVSDGYVGATVYLKDGTVVDLEPAWVIVGSPKFAPELVNIVTLDDTVYDISVRLLDYAPELYDATAWPGNPERYDPIAGFNTEYRPNFERDIKPIIERPGAYRWVAHTPTMSEFSHPAFDVRDGSDTNAAARKRYFSYFRVPVPPESYRFIDEVENGPNTLMSQDGVPLMPLNSGDNSVTNTLIYKFLTLTPTQYFFLHQWAEGKFDLGPAAPDLRGEVTELDRSVLGNVVGGPFSPGIETSWIVRSPKLYRKPFCYDIAHWSGNLEALATHYGQHGLSLTSDPQDGHGVEPGDLTKRMAIPWQADFFDCTIQTPNALDPAVNQSADGVQIAPTYYVYWWPPQSPMHVVAGDMDPGNQVLDGYVCAQPVQIGGNNGLTLNIQSQSGFSLTAAGQPVDYSRGINSFGQMTSAWKDLGFIVNIGTEDYQNFVESERNTNYLAQGAGLGIK
ncbi:CTQ-dependent lysine 6-oxidase LodA [Trinickia diaoshuihuensis]|uniref:CTQ-dependent lysine 6-oxidase LodA n=1 Tax=Trinickia diaoshuihuensis TaxID=2292265 RepID=UPI000E25F5CE|nr:CTQ-dependent lysine 6-oxidase LodA [Trinickia diaoshuihuensis]